LTKICHQRGDFNTIALSKKPLVSAEKELILLNIGIQLPEKKITWEKSLP
jgi:hypothetical protein